MQKDLYHPPARAARVIEARGTGGFTLVEMSVVLVIIGLIVGGVLVGQDLVKTAQIRATVAQIQNYDASVNTFRSKYDCMPGDCSTANAFGLGAHTGAAGNRGNGRLDDVDGGETTATTFDGELNDFWVHLSGAKMVDGTFAVASPSVAGTNIPATKLKKGSLIAISEGSINHWLVGSPSSIAVAALATTLGATSGKTINALEAFGIDTKLDDGNPVRGNTVAVEDVTTAAIVESANGEDCVQATAANGYDISAVTNECLIDVKMQGG